MLAGHSLKIVFLFSPMDFYPGHLHWRVNVSFILLVFALIPLLYEKLPYRKYGLIYSAVFPFITGWLLVGGYGLESVDTDSLAELCLL